MMNEPNSTPRVEDPRARILARYEGLKFVSAGTPDTSHNHTRGARKSPRRRFIR